MRRGPTGYRPGTSVTGIDLSTAVLDVARSRASASAAGVQLCVADAQHLALADARVDTVVATSARCSIPADEVAVSKSASHADGSADATSAGSDDEGNS